MKSEPEDVAADGILTDVRAAFDKWLESDDLSASTTEAWIRGHLLPAIGYADPPFVWTVRCLEADPPSRRSCELKIADRLKRLFEKIPREAENPWVEDEFLYNLFNLSAEIGVGEKLFEPLNAILGRVQDTGYVLRRSAQGALRDALIANQIDNRLWPVWETMLKGERHPVLFGSREIGFHATRMVPQPQPALAEMGHALTYLIPSLQEKAGRRADFQRLIATTTATIPGYQLWDYDLIVAARMHDWPLWAVDCLPSHVVQVPKDTSDEKHESAEEWILSDWIAEPLLQLDVPVESHVLCQGHLAKFTISEKDIEKHQWEIDHIEATRIETTRRDSVFYTDRAVFGAVSSALTAIELQHSFDDDSKSAWTTSLRRIREKFLRQADVGV